jgi:CubicO group peptidase (beta-lactamase class C family)
MRPGAFIAVAATALLLAPRVASGADAPPFQSRLDQMFQSWTRGNVPGCAAGVMRNGKWRAKGGYGAASLEHSVRITPKTVFNIASVSKQFTAATLLRLVDEGKVRLDDDVRKYFPEIPESSPPTTLTDLVYQTSGLGDYTPVLYRQGKYIDRSTRAEVLEIIVKEPRLAPPGQLYDYNNSNYFLIAEVIARVSGTSFREYARTRLFKPLGMHDSRFQDDYTEVVPRIATPYYEVNPGKYRVAKSLYQHVGAGGLLTTVEDLGKWLRVFQETNAIPGSPRLGERLLERGKFVDGGGYGYASGLRIHSERGTVVASHNGGFPGWSAIFNWVPSRRTGFLVLCNSDKIPIEAIQGNLLSEALQ